MSPSGAEPGPEGLRLGEPLARREQRGIISKGVKRFIENKVNPSTPQPKCWGLLRVDPERRFTQRPKGRSLAAPKGSNSRGL